MAEKKTIKPVKKPKREKKAKSGALGRAIFAILVTLALLALAFFLVVRDQGQTSIAENTVGSIFAPIENALSTATRYVRDVVDGVKDYCAISAALEEKEFENTNLKLQLQALEEDARENERLTDLLEAQERYAPQDPVYARVIARDPSVWFETFSINKGRNDGVEVNMSVITGDGLVGRVYEVGMNYAKVLSIIDTRSAVSCLIERTRDNGVMRGQISASSATSECYMYYLPVVNDIIPGDVVLTSGVDTLFPKGIVVGTVASVSRQSDLSDQYIVVTPSVDFLHIEEVLVLRTIVESDADNLPVMPTPTPRPTPVPTPTPTPTGDLSEEIPEEERPWALPTPLPEGAEPGQTPDVVVTPSPSPTFDPESMLPEDQWAM